MLKKLVVIAALVGTLAALPSASASGCPDPENPCDPTPRPLPTINLCKIDPRC